jgi:RNA-binding protein
MGTYPVYNCLRAQTYPTYIQGTSPFSRMIFMNPINSAQRKALRARAHSLDPMVIVGAGGLTAPVLAEVERALAAHELIKIRAVAAGRGEREAMLESACRETGAVPVQHIGKILVIFRERPEQAAPRAAVKANKRRG